MSHIECVDISQWQGAYQDYGTPILIIKVSGGDNGVYFDSQATNNYNRATADGKAVGMYHFAGGTDPIVESNFFIRACSPLAENDVLVLDWEVSHPDPVGWCKAFVENVHSQTGVWPLLYINLSTLRAHDWSLVLNNCGLWLAAWNGDPEADIDTGGHPYVMQQYQGTPLDRDAWFGSIDQFRAYGYHAPSQNPPVPAETTVDPPITEPVITPPLPDNPVTTITPIPSAPVPNTPPATSPPEHSFPELHESRMSILARFLAWLSKKFNERIKR